MDIINVILFDEFETLDAFGPVALLGKLDEFYQLEYYSQFGGLVTSSQQVSVQTKDFSELMPEGIVLIPGGRGTRTLVNVPDFIYQLTQICVDAKYVLTVCTGAALLAMTGLINRKRATSNKRAFAWVRSVNSQVKWVKSARWVVADKVYSASGVSAGMDMTLGFIADQHGKAVADEVAHKVEYTWHEVATIDPFAIV